MTPGITSRYRGTRSGGARPSARLLGAVIRVLLGVSALGWLGGCADREGEAQQAMKGAAQEMVEARRLESESYAAALERYEAALAVVGKVRTEYADTPAGALAGKPSTYVGPVTLGVLDSVVLPAVRRRAEAEASPLACAAFMAETIPGPAPRVQALATVAKAAAQLDRTTIAGRMLKVAQATAAGLPAGSEAQDHAWESVADTLIAARDLEQARSLILAHGFEGPWQRLAVALVKTGQTQRAAGMVAHSLGGAPMPRLEARAVIAAALWREGDTARAQQLMNEAEYWAKAVTPEEVPRAGLVLARHYAMQRALPQADSWLTQVDGLRVANRDELDGLVEAYRAGGGESRLLARVHDQLTSIEAGTTALPSSEVPWLANVAYLQAKLGEAEPGAFALSQARTRADAISAVDSPPGLDLEVTTLMDISERLLTIGHIQPGLGALEDALDRVRRYPLPMRPPFLLRAAKLAAYGGKADRALNLIEQLTTQEQIAGALAEAAQASRGGLVASPRSLHDLAARFDTLEGLH
ncbi:MAG: hypothetical protein VKP62_14240 [Candidatus Sericytochromatia bacterium]|nr:hypothetical protein [Candidatus Sericytochromatia bacterium]